MNANKNREKARVFILAVLAVTAIGSIMALIIVGSKQSASAADTKKSSQNPTSQSFMSSRTNEPSAGKAQSTVSSFSKASDKSIVIYSNGQYGFTFTLPLSWKGYTILSDTWNGTKYEQNSEQTVASGPIIKIRDPRWTAQVPRQDIPIMVFTLSQWNSLQNNEYHIGAAPIGPTELDRNDSYVFALPARYNFYNLPGIDEVSKIIDSKPLKATKPAGN